MVQPDHNAEDQIFTISTTIEEIPGRIPKFIPAPEPLPTVTPEQPVKLIDSFQILVNELNLYLDLFQVRNCGICAKECTRVYALSVAERLSLVFAVRYVPRGIDSSLLLSCNSCKMAINGRGGLINALPKASLSMCTHFPAVSGISGRLVLLNLANIRKDINSIRAAVEQKGVVALPCGILDNRRSAVSDSSGLARLQICKQLKNDGLAVGAVIIHLPQFFIIITMFEPI